QHSTTPTDNYTLSLHDALPICQETKLEDEELALPTELQTARTQETMTYIIPRKKILAQLKLDRKECVDCHLLVTQDNVRMFDFEDRKSTRLNSSHRTISYAVFC